MKSPQLPNAPGMTGPSAIASLARGLRPWAQGLAAGLLAMALFVPAPAQAESTVYYYETPSGELVMTNYRMPGYKLIRKVMGDEGEGRAGVRGRPRTGGPSSQELSFRERERRYDDIIREASQTYSVPFAFVKAVIRAESSFHPRAVSPVGAMGLMQLMPSTAASMGVTDAFDPRQNIFGGAKFLRILTDRYDGDINLILAAYNAGDVAVRKYSGIPYRKTAEYVASVYHWYKAYTPANEARE